jgi:aspartate aminotransferase-like enzyme
MAESMQATATGRFFLPGPTEVSQRVLQAMTRQMIGHRVPEMEDLIGHVQPILRDIFRTQRPVYISASIGDGSDGGSGSQRRAAAGALRS